MKKYLLLLFLFGITLNASSQSQFNKPQGYMGLVEVGGGIGMGDWGANRVSVTMINGYRIIPQFAAGIGVGAQMLIYSVFDGNNDQRDIVMSLPVFLHLRSDFIEGKVSPFVALNIGYNVLTSDDIKDGLTFEPMVGVSFNLGKKRMTAGVGFSMSKINYEVSNGGWSYYDFGSATGSALTFKVGYSF